MFAPLSSPSLTIGQRLASLAGVAALALLATGCATVNPPPPVDVLPTTPPMLPVAQHHGQGQQVVATGSLFQAGRYRPAFEDQRARYVGDMVTIQIREKIDAKQNSGSDVSRKSDSKGGISIFPFLSDKLAGKTQVGAGYESAFEGKGGTSSKNEFTSSITAIVTEVLPNGNLVITGEKQVGVNRSVDVLRFSGMVDPRHLRRGTGHNGSTIDSEYVANVRVVSRGMGEQAEAQAMGWLGRAFNSVSPF